MIPTNRRLILPILAFLLCTAGYLVTLKPVFLHRGGGWTRILTHASSVAVVLREAGVTLEGNDRPLPGMDAPVRWGMTIELPVGGAIPILYHGEIRYAAVPGDGAVSVRALLDQAAIELADGEWVFADGTALPPDAVLTDAPLKLEIRPAVEFLLLEDGRTTRHSAPGPTVGEALWQAGITVYAADQVIPAGWTELDSIGTSPAVIEVIRSRPVVILADGKETAVRAAGKTVGDALAGAGFALTGLDYSVPAEGEPLPQDGRIRIVRVREEILREQSQIAFERETQPLADLELDETRVVQPGAYGILESTVRIRYEDGEEVSRTPEGRHVLLEPQNRIVGYGTQVVVRTVDTPDGTVEYYRAITVYATSYSPCRLGVTPPRCNNITHSGKILQKGMIAMVLPWYYLFQGQGVYVDGYGPATVEDSGAGPNAPYWIDLAYLDEDYVAWHRNTTLYFLTPVPANVPWILP
jgi:uncharacterized protein YabE (DUF348 family)